jgi:hypothetical protein
MANNKSTVNAKQKIPCTSCAGKISPFTGVFLDLDQGCVTAKIENSASIDLNVETTI